VEVILLRHSIAEGNRERRFLGRTDAPLTAEGIVLAKERSHCLMRVEHVYVSPLIRAKETAAILWPDIPAEERPGLREVDFGILENRTHDELSGDAAYEAWLREGGGKGYPGGESFLDFENRAKDEFLKIIADAAAKGKEKIGIVTHGGVIMKIAASLCPTAAGGEKTGVSNCNGFHVVLKNKIKAIECIDIMPI